MPESALGFVVLNEPATLDAKVQAFAREAQLPAPGLLAMLKQTVGIREGMDEKGTVAMVVLPPETEAEAPAAILLIPVSDYDKFLEPFNAEESDDPSLSEFEVRGVRFYVRNIGGYAAVTDVFHQETLASALTVSAEAPATVAAWKDWLKDKDIAAVLLPPGVKMLSAKAQEGIEQAKAMFAEGPDEMQTIAGILTVYEKLFQATEREVAAVGISLGIDEKNVIRLTKRAKLVPGGSWSKFAASVRPADKNLLAGLPDEPFVFAAGGKFSDAVWQAMFRASARMMKNMHEFYRLDEEQAEKMAALSSDMMKGCQAMSMVMGVAKEGGSVYSSTAGVMQVDDAGAFMASYEKSFRQYSELLQDVDSPLLPKMVFETTDVDGVAALEFTMQMPEIAEADLPAGGMMKAMLGPGGKLVGWVVPAGEHAVVFCYDKTLLKRTIEAVKQGAPGLAANSDVAKTAALLPSDAAVVGYVSPQGVMGFVRQLFASAAESGAPVPDLPEFPATPPVGFALSTSADELNGTIVIPPEVIRAVGQYAEQMQAQ